VGEDEEMSWEDIVKLLDKYGTIELKDVKIKGTVELELG